MMRPAVNSQRSIRLVSSHDCRTARTDPPPSQTDALPRFTNAESNEPAGEVDLAAGAAAVYDKQFRGLSARLQMAAAACMSTTVGDAERVMPHHVRDGILECATALDQVHARLTLDIGRLYQVERELHDARCGLAQAQAEIARVRVSEKRERHLATHDALTALPNRRLFQKRLIQALSRSAAPRQTLAVFYIDLDGFKSVNDTYGHDTGDRVLRIMAARLAHAVRADDSVGRLGGDEFAYLLTELPDQGRIGGIAGTLFATLSAPIKVGNLEIIMKPSIGIAVSPDNGVTAEELLRNADAAMYHAKRHGAGHVFFAA